MGMRDVCIAFSLQYVAPTAQILTRRLIPSSVLDVVLGALLTAADVNNKYHAIKVEKAHVSGNFCLVGTHFLKFQTYIMLLIYVVIFFFSSSASLFH
jgi:hypothetical protein